MTKIRLLEAFRNKSFLLKSSRYNDRNIDIFRATPCQSGTRRNVGENLTVSSALSSPPCVSHFPGGGDSGLRWLVVFWLGIHQDFRTIFVNSDSFINLSVQRFLEISYYLKIKRRWISFSVMMVDLEVLGKCIGDIYLFCAPLLSSQH